MAYRGWRRNGTKYNATKCIVDGIKFDSKHEAERYLELKLLERGKAISDLRLQVKFTLIPAQYEKDTVTLTKSGKEKIVKGKCIERECAYYADFVYILNETGETIVEDAKSAITKENKEYIIKRKILLWRYGVRIHEV